MNSIRTRLLIWLMVPLTLVAAIVGIETFLSSQKISNDLHDKTLFAAMIAISENVVASNGTLLADDTLSVLTESLGDKYFYHVIGPGGSFLTGYSGFPTPPDDVELVDGKPLFYDGRHLGNEVRVIALRQLLVGRELNGLTTITAWQRVTQRSRLTISLFTRSLLRLLLLVIAAGTIVWFAVSIGLRPLIQLRKAIENRTPYDLTPIKRAMPVELSGIVQSMNELFARVDRSKTNRELFIGNAAHQLRNPVAAIKVQAQSSIESGTKKDMASGLVQIVDASDKAGTLINQMLSNASAHALTKDNMAMFDLAQTVREATHSLAAIALDKGHEISLRLDEENYSYQGNRTLINEAIINLIDNAIKHNAKGHDIDVSLKTKGEMLRIDISDSGEAFTEEVLIKYSQPFSTGNQRTAGNGLGLSLVKDVAKSHGGYLGVSTTNDKSGKTISIYLPTQTQKLSC